MKVTERLKGKDILIWGYGLEGKSTERFIKDLCDVKSLSIFEGAQEDIEEDKYDYIIKSPGIVAEKYGDNFTSQTELFLEEFSKQTVGITGTKGKSTVTAMLYKTLSECTSKKVLLAGNLGYPCLDHYEEIDDNTVIVFEMSCHQLSHLKYSPHVAIFLNLYEDHLDYYGTFEKYFEAKKNITVHQDEGDWLYCGKNVPEIDTKAQIVRLPFAHEKHFDLKIVGEHNQFNAGVVDKVCVERFGCAEDKVREAIEQFSGLPHRLEFFSNIKGVDYYDDSISTIPEATIQALQSIPNAKTAIIGGMDRNIDYDILISFVRENEQYDYIFAYSSGERIYKEVKDFEYCYYVDDLEAAVRLAKIITPNGMACVLSPAAASYGYFKNFEERGERFKQLVLDNSIS